MIIKVENLTKEYKIKVKNGFWKDAFFPEYKNVSAVSGVTFNIEKGESVALLGPNGAGKTTTMKMLSGLLYPTSGKVDVLGYFPFDRKREFLMKIGLVMGNKSGLAWDLTPNQNFELAKKIYRIEESIFAKRLGELTEILNVGEYSDKQVRKLSLGERMKFELIASILHSPDVLFLDEPTIGLDIVSRQKIRTFLREVQKKSGATLLLTSHDMDDVEKVTDRVIVINQGSIVFNDSMSKLLYKYKNKKYVTLILTEKVTAEEIKKYGKIIERKPLSFTLEIKSEDQARIIASIMESLPVDDIDIVHVPLEEIIADMFTSRVRV
jgi:ABC-2 type transport system ATP-binding protein